MTGTSTSCEQTVRRAAPFSRADPASARRCARHAGRPVPERGFRRPAAAAGLGPHYRDADWPARQPAARGDQRRDDPGPRAVRRVPGGRPDRPLRPAFPPGRASWTRRWSTSRGSATCSYSARPPGGSRTSPRTRCSSRPRPGQPGRLPFWKGDAPGRPAELGAAIGAFSRELGARQPSRRPPPGCADEGLDELAAANLVSYLHQQREATGYLPDDRTLVLERFRDELGDWRLVLHSPYGSQLHAPWALAIAARLRERYGGMDVQALHTDDGIVIRVPDADDPPPAGIAMLDPDEVEQLVTAELGASALFASRFRECAARALLLPRRQPGRRTPLWQQRQRSAQLLAVASQYGHVPDRARDHARVPAGRLRRAGPDAADARHRGASGPAGRGRDADGVPVQQVAALPVRRRVHVRGRRAARRAARPGARPGLGAARRAARPGRAARAARSARRRRDRAGDSSGWRQAVPARTPRTSPTCCAHLGR